MTNQIDDDISLSLQNTLLLGNSCSTGPDCYGTIGNLSYSLIEDTTDCTITSGSPLTGSERLGSLRDNGGDTKTHLPRSTSAAIDAGDPAGCKDADGNTLTTDQRGSDYPRPVDGDGDGTAVCDIGAVERQDDDSSVLENPEKKSMPGGMPTIKR